MTFTILSRWSPIIEISDINNKKIKNPTLQNILNSILAEISTDQKINPTIYSDYSEHSDWYSDRYLDRSSD